MTPDKFAWKKEYALGHPDIDAEHKKLFEIATRAFSASTPDARLEKVKTTIKDLYDYMKTHFSNEEAFMRTISYPYDKDHGKLHEAIIVEMNGIIKRMPSMKLHEIERELAGFVERGLVHHITMEDRKIHRWLAEKLKSVSTSR